jgi:hypothetical protein
VKNVGRVKAKIHLITSRQATDGEKYADSWRGTTESEIRLYSGYGEHSGMLTSGTIEGNAEILNRILEEIGNRLNELKKNGGSLEPPSLR